MEYRAKTAEKESALLKERLEELKEQLDKVTFSTGYGVHGLFDKF